MVPRPQLLVSRYAKTFFHDFEKIIIFISIFQLRVIADVPETILDGNLQVVEELRRVKARRIHFERELFFRKQIAITNQIEARLEKMFAVSKVDCELIVPGIR